mmetsp:Transcript_9751/g.27572  ORF Transcript_9751/g.27572 Transcript_9751/m.27572 type:complete len:200 (-) Transcript_9751:673-1272(-)
MYICIGTILPRCSSIAASPRGSPSAPLSGERGVRRLDRAARRGTKLIPVQALAAGPAAGVVGLAVSLAVEALASRGGRHGWGAREAGVALEVGAARLGASGHARVITKPGAAARHALAGALVVGAGTDVLLELERGNRGGHGRSRRERSRHAVAQRVVLAQPGARDVLLDPWQKKGNAGVHAGLVGTRTARAPRDQPKH